MLKKILRKYIGLGLPVRSFVLDFSFPETSLQLQVGSGSYLELFMQLEEEKENPNQYFSILWSIVKHLNRCVLNPKQRLSFTHQILRLFYPKAIESVLQLAQKNGGVSDIPEPENNAQALKYISEISKTLAISYQIIFYKIYKSNNFQYVRKRHLRQECVSSIFELMLLRQQALAQRYQLLDEMDWRAINSLFHAMQLYEEKELNIHWATLSKQLAIKTGRNRVSWQTLFTQIHLTAQFDMLRWSRHLQWVIGSYVDGVKDSVTVSLLGSIKPTSNQRIASFSNPPLLLDFNGLNNAIRQDCMGLLQCQKKRNNKLLPARFSRFIETERFVVFHQLMLGAIETPIHQPQPQPQSTDRSIGSAMKDLRIYVGFNDVFSLLAHQQSSFAHEVRLADVLARRSAKIAKDHTVTETSLWLLVEQTSEMLRLSTEENNYTTRINLGSIVAYGISEDEIKRPKLAVVARIYRPNNKRVIIDLHTLANYAESVIVTLNGKPQKYKALLIYDIRYGAHWRIVLQPQNLAIGFDQLLIERHGKKISIALEKWHSATNDFYLYSITLTSADLGISGEPQYPINHEP